MTIRRINSKEGPAQPLSKEEIRQYFLGFDKDKNGVLTKQEIKEAFEGLCALIPAYRAHKTIAVADKDGDGCVNIKDHEFEALIDYVYELRYTKFNTPTKN